MNNTVDIKKDIKNMINTTNNITRFLESLTILDINVINPTYEQIFSNMTDFIDGISFTIDREPGLYHYNDIHTMYNNRNDNVYKNNFLLLISDIIQVKDINNSVYINNINNTSYISYNYNYNVPQSCLLPICKMKNIVFNFQNIFGRNVRIKSYILSIKNKSILHKMGNIINEEGLCFTNNFFSGVYQPVPEKLSLELSSDHT